MGGPPRRSRPCRSSGTGSATSTFGSTGRFGRKWSRRTRKPPRRCLRSVCARFRTATRRLHSPRSGSSPQNSKSAAQTSPPPASSSAAPSANAPSASSSRAISSSSPRWAKSSAAARSTRNGSRSTLHARSRTSSSPPSRPPSRRPRGAEKFTRWPSRSPSWTRRSWCGRPRSISRSRRATSIAHGSCTSGCWSGRSTSRSGCRTASWRKLTATPQRREKSSHAHTPNSWNKPERSRRPSTTPPTPASRGTSARTACGSSTRGNPSKPGPWGPRRRSRRWSAGCRSASSGSGCCGTSAVPRRAGRSTTITCLRSRRRRSRS
mmetsp:Transcript_26949/g.67631  ORF Transcript_26949/g.67631 Transcript_26949/m.67631 type:complete len:321 (-) Transcript_26949:778-1740(-)